MYRHKYMLFCCHHCEYIRAETITYTEEPVCNDMPWIHLFSQSPIVGHDDDISIIYYRNQGRVFFQQLLWPLILVCFCSFSPCFESRFSLRHQAISALVKVNLFGTSVHQNDEVDFHFIFLLIQVKNGLKFFRAPTGYERELSQVQDRKERNTDQVPNTVYPSCSQHVKSCNVLTERNRTINNHLWSVSIIVMITRLCHSLPSYLYAKQRYSIFLFYYHSCEKISVLRVLLSLTSLNELPDNSNVQLV